MSRQASRPVPGLESAPIFAAFLQYARKVPPNVQAVLDTWGIDREATERFGIRYYFHGYRRALADLAKKVGKGRLIDAGLLVPLAPEVSEGSGILDLANAAQLVGCFDAYREAGVPYLMLPYFRQRQPVFIKARPLVVNKVLNEKGLPQSLASGHGRPCWYNVDVIDLAERIVVVRREVDAIVLTARGIAAIACGSLSNIDQDWAGDLADKDVIVLTGEKKQSDPRMAYLESLCLDAGAQSFRPMAVPNGVTGAALADYLSVELAKPYVPEPAPTPPTTRPTAADLDISDDLSEPGGAQLDQQLLDGDLQHEHEEAQEARADDVLDDPEPQGASGSTVGEIDDDDQFVAAIPFGKGRALAIFAVEGEFAQELQVQYWSEESGGWAPDMEEFNLPMNVGPHIIAAIQAAAAGKTSTPRPDWL